MSAPRAMRWCRKSRLWLAIRQGCWRRLSTPSERDVGVFRRNVAGEESQSRAEIISALRPKFGLSGGTRQHPRTDSNSLGALRNYVPRAREDGGMEHVVMTMSEKINKALLWKPLPCSRLEPSTSSGCGLYPRALFRRPRHDAPATFRPNWHRAPAIAFPGSPIACRHWCRYSCH